MPISHSGVLLHFYLALRSYVSLPHSLPPNTSPLLPCLKPPLNLPLRTSLSCPIYRFSSLHLRPFLYLHPSPYLSSVSCPIAPKLRTPASSCIPFAPSISFLATFRSIRHPRLLLLAHSLNPAPYPILFSPPCHTPLHLSMILTPAPPLSPLTPCLCILHFSLTPFPPFSFIQPQPPAPLSLSPSPSW